MEKAVIFAATSRELLEEALSISAYRPFVVFGTLDSLTPIKSTSPAPQAGQSPVKVYFYEHG